MPQQPTVELPELPMRPPEVAGRDGNLASSLPLRGVTILAVEDSRFASEALRLMCLRLGARLRRAETIHQAHSHLRLYRPDVVIIDLGLPDGRGEALIRELLLTPHPPVILGMSGDPDGRSLALAAGAEGFLEKPLESLAAFHSLLRAHLPNRNLGATEEDSPLHPDDLALQDDLARAAEIMDAGLTPESTAYLGLFLSGIAAHSHDPDLIDAMKGGSIPLESMEKLRNLIDRRLAHRDMAFAAKREAD